MFRTVIVALTLTFTLPLVADGFKDRYSGNLLRLYGPSATRTSRLTMGIDAVTSDEEVQALRMLLRSEGAAAVMKRLADVEMGAIFTTGSIAVPLCFVRIEQKPDGKGRRIIGIAARRIAFQETWHQTRSLDYPWSVVILEVDAKGKGEGKLLEAAKIEMAENGKVEITYNTTQPARVLNVKHSDH